jgi:hypothetical protein
MKLLLLCLLVPVTCSAMSAECPVRDTVAYSRQTTSGIPGPRALAGSPDKPDKPVRVSYLVYVVLKKGAVPSSAAVWLEGKYFGATLHKVDSPVVVEHDVAVPTGHKDTLVGRTSDDVYQVDLDAERPWSPRDEAEKGSTLGNQAVIFLQVGQVACPCPVKEIKALRPAPGM